MRGPDSGGASDRRTTSSVMMLQRRRFHRHVQSADFAAPGIVGDVLWVAFVVREWVEDLLFALFFAL